VTSETDLRSLTILALGVLTRGRTYLNLLYLALSLPLATLYVAILVLCTVAGTVLSVVGIGVIILLGGLAAASGFATLERELAVALLGLDLPPPPPPLPAGSPWHRLRAHLARAETWKSLAYLTLKLPFGLFTYALGGLLLVPAMGLLLYFVRDFYPGPGLLSLIERLGGGLFGFALLLAALHGANLLAGIWSRIAVAILGPSEQQRQLWAAQRDAEAARGAAEAANRKRRELIVNVSHELRTPIASIQGHLESLLMPSGERPPDVDPQRYLTVAAAETRRLSTLVTELLELARADRSELAISIKSVDVVPLARDVAVALGPLARQERQVTLVIHDGSGSQIALADPDRLTQVVANLVRNAINHTPAGGAVKVSTGPDDPDHVVVTVSDTGSGIAPEDLERIFDRFYRSDEGRARDSGGFGIGLSIAKELVEAMGGTITAASQLGVGSTFQVRLKKASV
jgi:two-component system, OmpR family, phosphate regulon sensor histidine kinase PhoR